MKILSILCVMLFSTIFIQVDENQIIEIRNLYQKGVKDKKANQKLNLLLAKVTENEPVLLGYKGAAIMMQASYAIDPFTKLSKFKKGKNLIEYAIKKEANNTELRYVRLTIQTNIPSFLGYSGEIKNDKDFILEQLPHLKDADLSNRIIKYLSSKNICNDEELKKIDLWKSK